MKATFMRELKTFALRFLVAAFLIAFCMTISRAADLNAQATLHQAAEHSLSNCLR